MAKLRLGLDLERPCHVLAVTEDAGGKAGFQARSVWIWHREFTDDQPITNSLGGVLGTFFGIVSQNENIIPGQKRSLVIAVRSHKCLWYQFGRCFLLFFNYLQQPSDSSWTFLPGREVQCSVDPDRYAYGQQDHV